MKTMKRFLATMMAMIVMAGIPMQAKAAEVAQPAVESETIQFVELKAGYYKEIEKDGVFNRYDADGNLISSTKVEDALFEVNADLTSGWGQTTVEGSLIKGNIANITLDVKGYLRATFTTESGVVYEKITVKVNYTAPENWDKLQRPCTVSAPAKTNKSVAVVDGNSGNSDDGGNDGSGSNGGNGGNSGDPDPGNKGWTGGGSNPAPSGDLDPGHKGW